jgi:hypothetical protein
VDDNRTPAGDHGGPLGCNVGSRSMVSVATTMIPPSTSFVSAKGPSVATTDPASLLTTRRRCGQASSSPPTILAP